MTYHTTSTYVFTPMQEKVVVSLFVERIGLEPTLSAFRIIGRTPFVLEALLLFALPLLLQFAKFVAELTPDSQKFVRDEW